MVQFDNQFRQVKLKIVYYGPALGGKTTCLQHIHGVVDPERRTTLYSLNTATDRTLFFDLMSLELGRIRGYRLALQLYTVPGQVHYGATRRAVLSGADGVVFVADSQESQAQPNRDSLADLADNLLANGLDPESIPMVLVYNKRDLTPLLPVESLDRDLNRRGEPAFATVAISGEGVMAAFAAIVERTVLAVAGKLGVAADRTAIERLAAQVRGAIEPLVVAEGPVRRQDDVRVVRQEGDPPSDQEAVSQDALVGEAVRANLAMTDLGAQLDSMRRQLERKVRVLSGVTEFSRTVGASAEPGEVLRELLRATVRLLRVQAAAVLFVPGSGPLREAAVHGLEHDPLLATLGEIGEPLATSVVEAREPRLVVRELDEEGSLLVRALEGAGFSSGLAVPMVAQDRVVGLLTAYGDRSRRPLDEDDLQLAAVLGGSAAVGYTSVVAWRRLEGLNRDLAAQVAERTRELESSLERAKGLAGELAEKNRLLEEAYRDLAQVDRIKNELITRISHELKTPVTSLLTAARILDRYRDAPPEKNARFVEIIRGEAEKLSEIVSSVLQAAVLTTRGDELRTRPVPAEELFRDAMAPLRDLARLRGVRLVVRIPSGLDGVSCDPETMAAALRAVIKNAIEFSDAGGEVTIETRRLAAENRPWLQITVRDRGSGVPEDELPHVFESFWQGGQVLTGKPRGVGLGLTIARRVLELHGGTVTFDSRVGEGTEVAFTLPQEGEGGGP